MLSWLGRFTSSSIGKKTLMALTGLLLIGFLVAHLLGNLTLYTSNEAFLKYEHKLESLGPLLTVMEVGLLALFAVHIVLAMKVSRENREARPQRYQVRADAGMATPASRSMLITGLIVGVFLVIHVLDFRIPKLLGADSTANMAVAVRERLASPVGAFIYLVGVIALGVHLRHAFQSAFQSLGVNHPRYTPLIQGLGIALAVLLFLGFASFPVLLFLQGGAA